MRHIHKIFQLFFQAQLQRPGQLVGAGGSPAAAVRAFQPPDHLPYLHAFNQLGYALGIPAAAPGKRDVFYLSVLDLKINFR